ncbi:disease resistance RPP8-like protein 3 [Salvia hispanica]|uniref:disease resistance RPP8-like protein 3 n=1 Tax=Salvia hispanica TaxID=49212 RepID=UPI002009BCC8|nr:disease resistance RPP8-like protein 3 [Salvia hispanica]
MSEGIILGAMIKVENFLDESEGIITYDEQILKEVVNELRMMLKFLSDKESGERSRLDDLVAEFAEMAQFSVSQLSLIAVVSSARNWLRKLKKWIMEFGETSVEEERDKGIVVGLEKDVHQLISRAIISESGSRTICIKGMIGSGKTTLARQVYNHPAVVEKFKHRRAWISLSRDTSEKEVLVELIHKLGYTHDGDSLLLEDIDNWSLQSKLWDSLLGIPTFVVLDNVSPKMNLDIIDRAISPSAMESRLLLTSCYSVIPDYCYTYEMKALDLEKSWQLFLKTFDKFTSDENKFSKELERKGKEMLKQCGGLPLAIVDVGRQKAEQKLSGIELEQLFDSVDFSGTLKLLEPMYHELDEDLKPCFWHMSFFKENAIMKEEKLQQIWDINGLKFGSCSQLASQSVIEVVHPRPRFAGVKSCRIHLLLHRLSIEKAEEKMGFEILGSNVSNRPSRSPRHRVIRCGREKFSHSTNQDKQLSSLIFHGGGRYLDNASQSYWKSFELLKILDMEDFGVKTLSETIGTLTELRYLGLRNNYVQEIPHSFGGLIKLEVLDIAQNFLIEVPDIIKDMSSLQYLYMCDVIYRNPLEVDALTNLRTLTHISIFDCTFEASSLEKMTCLYELGIEEMDENSNVSKLFASLAELESLCKLTLRGFRFRNMPCLDEIVLPYRVSELTLNGRLARLPSHDIMYRISSMSLVNTCLDEDPIPVLEYLPLLIHLKLRNAYIGRDMVITSLSEVQFLYISEMWNLRNVQFREGSMFELKQLEIENCPHLETLQHGREWNLKKFKMVTTKQIATKIMNSDFVSGILEVDISP